VIAKVVNFQVVFVPNCDSRVLLCPSLVVKTLTSVIYRPDMQTEYTCCVGMFGLLMLICGLHEVLLNQKHVPFLYVTIFTPNGFIL